MNGVKTFFLTEVKNTGYLAAAGNIGLAPVRYLLGGKTFEVIPMKNTQTEETAPGLNRITPKSGLVAEKQSTVMNMLKTVAAIILLAPGLILSVAKILSYGWAEVRDWNHAAQKQLTPVVRTLPNGDPAKDAQTLKQAMGMQFDDMNFKPLEALVLRGNNFDLDTKDLDYVTISKLNPKKLIIEGMRVDTIDMSKTVLGKFLLDNPKWDIMVRTAASKDAALQHSPARQGWLTCKPMHAVYIVVPDSAE